MKEHEHFQQSPLPLDAQPAEVRLPQPSYEHPPSGKPVPSFAITGARTPLPSDFAEEYASELATRDRLGLPELSPSAFRQIRNWRDGIKEDAG